MNRALFFLGSAAGLTGVALGAFGAHGLRNRLSPEMLSVFETGVRYQLYHALAMLAAALSAPALGRLATAGGWCFAAGIFLFSGSLYVLALTGLTRLGIVTPFGGLAFLLGWGCLAVSALGGR